MILVGLGISLLPIETYTISPIRVGKASTQLMIDQLTQYSTELVGWLPMSHVSAELQSTLKDLNGSAQDSVI